jgi:hypothetical protein
MLFALKCREREEREKGRENENLKMIAAFSSFSSRFFAFLFSSGGEAGVAPPNPAKWVDDTLPLYPKIVDFGAAKEGHIVSLSASPLSLSLCRPLAVVTLLVLPFVSEMSLFHRDHRCETQSKRGERVQTEASLHFLSFLSLSLCAIEVLCASTVRISLQPSSVLRH